MKGKLVPPPISDEECDKLFGTGSTEGTYHRDNNREKVRAIAHFVWERVAPLVRNLEAFSYENGKTLYAAMTNTDLNDGSGHQYVLQLATLPETAQRIGKGRHVQGSNCPVIAVETKVIGSRSFVPLEIFHVAYPCKEDQALADKRLARDAVIDKARAAGLSEEEIAILVSR